MKDSDSWIIRSTAVIYRRESLVVIVQTTAEVRDAVHALVTRWRQWQGFYSLCSCIEEIQLKTCKSSSSCHWVFIALEGTIIQSFLFNFPSCRKKMKNVGSLFSNNGLLNTIFFYGYENIQTIFRIYLNSATDIRIRVITAGCEFVSVIWSTVLVRNAKWIMNSASDFASNALNVKLFLTPLCIGKSCGEKKT